MVNMNYERHIEMAGKLQAEKTNCRDHRQTLHLGLNRWTSSRASPWHTSTREQHKRTVLLSCHSSWQPCSFPFSLSQKKTLDAHFKVRMFALTTHSCMDGPNTCQEA